MPPRIPQPTHRHAAPYAPWPFLDLDSEVCVEAIRVVAKIMLIRGKDRNVVFDNAPQYPQSLYPNWTAIQQEKSGITKLVNRGSKEHCTISHVDVREDGVFIREQDEVVTEQNNAEFWDALHKEIPSNVRLRALFLDNLNGSVLQMLGTKYNIEPFFFSSSLNWIPARYQEAVGEGDHITFTLTFIRCMQTQTTRPSSRATTVNPDLPTQPTPDPVIDTGAPMQLGTSTVSTHVLIPDILAIHMVRSPTLSTIISYHPPHAHRTTTARTLSTRLQAAGQSSTRVDNSVDRLMSLPGTTPTPDEHADLTHRLHLLRANLWHYASLLEDFRKSVVFVAETRNPMLQRTSDAVKELMRKESMNLLNEIARLEQSRNMQNNRVKNLMNLAFSSVNLEDSKTMRELTEAAVRDSAAMKRISYLTMFFLPPSLAASLFGMNVREIVPNTYGSVRHYVAFAVPLTLITICLLIAFTLRKKDPNRSKASWSFQWPLVLREMGGKLNRRRQKRLSRQYDEALSLPNPSEKYSTTNGIISLFVLKPDAIGFPASVLAAASALFLNPHAWNSTINHLTSAAPCIPRCQFIRRLSHHIHLPCVWCREARHPLDPSRSLHWANANAREMPPRVPQPSHRHGAPSGPWPFLDLDSEVPHSGHRRRSSSIGLRYACLLSLAPRRGPDSVSQYPQSLYPNWSATQRQKSGITKFVNHVSRESCTIYHVDVRADGTFTREEDDVVSEDNKTRYWEKLQEDLSPEVRLQALFVENLSGPVLQMLGTRFNVEPFFFSSSLNWIPARYQEAVGEGDHITFTLTFIRCMQNPTTMPPSPTSSYSPSIPSLQSADQVIDTQAPLSLSSSNHILLPDILAIHMVRSPSGSTIISYHPPHNHRTTPAHTLRTRLLAAGQSVYWNKIFTSTISSDPTFVLLALLWYPLYAFDESLEALYLHICWLESRVMATTDMTLTQQLHVVRAHLLHYASLLEDFRKSVVFVAETPNPMLDHISETNSQETITFVKDLMRRESTNLLNEIARLEQSRSMQDNRLKNVMNLAFSSVNLEDSRRMQKMTEAALRDSAAMKQISYLTMFFLPASFAASVFGMNVKEITPGTRGTLAHYIAFALPMTAITIWVIMAFQYRKKDPNRLIHDDDDREHSKWSLSKLQWPLTRLRKTFRRSVTASRVATSSRPNSTRMSRPPTKPFDISP
ncbi:hypothetical protein C8R46DRAFT_889831 [Mycena filopes]|nr:hypothetical protein C8R46DRAFT_889831 [Mycena filopes]